MGGLAAVVRSAVAAASAATAGLQVEISHEAWIGQDAKGDEQFAPAVALQALVQRDPGIDRAQAGQEVKLLAVVTFLEPVPANGAAGRQEPIDPRDRIVLPDGRTGPIVKVSAGMLDPDSELPYMTQVRLGKG